MSIKFNMFLKCFIFTENSPHSHLITTIDNRVDTGAITPWSFKCRAKVQVLASEQNKKAKPQNIGLGLKPYL